MVEAGMGFWSSRAEGFVDNDLNCALDLKCVLRRSSRLWRHHLGMFACMGMESRGVSLVVHCLGSQEVDPDCVFLPNSVVRDRIGNWSPTGNGQVQRICCRSISHGDNCAVELLALVLGSTETPNDVCGTQSSAAGIVE